MICFKIKQEMSEIKKWKTLSSEYVFRRPWLTARRDKVMLPNGQINDEFYILEYPTWINVLAITEDGHYVLEEQFRQGLNDVFIELPAGVAEEGEDPETAARRELEEETGYTGGEWELLSVISANPSVNNNLTYCYLAKGVRLTSCQHLDRTEDIAVKLVTHEELTGIMERDEMKQALMAAPIWKYLYELGKKS